MEKITGYTESELLKMHPWEIIAPEFRERVKNAIGERSQGRKGPVLYQEIKLLTKDREERWGRFTQTASSIRNVWQNWVIL